MEKEWEGGRGSQCEMCVPAFTSQELSIKNWYISEIQEENKNIFIKNVTYIELKKKYNYFPKQATLAWVLKHKMIMEIEG